VYPRAAGSRWTWSRSSTQALTSASPSGSCPNDGPRSTLSGMAIRRAQPDLLKGEPLKQAVRKICAEEFKRVTYEPWRSRGYPSLSTWERFYEAHKRVAALVRSVIETMNQLRALRGGRFNLFLGEWLKDSEDRFAEMEFEEPPPTVRAYVVRSLEREHVPFEVAEDTRTRAARAPAPKIYWKGGGRRYRPMTDREMAHVTLLIGLWPDVQPKTLMDPRDVIRQEAKAIAQVRRRRGPKPR